MENAKIIDKTNQKFFEIPIFYPINPINPYKLEPISIAPL